MNNKITKLTIRIFLFAILFNIIAIDRIYVKNLILLRDYIEIIIIFKNVLDISRAFERLYILFFFLSLTVN